MFVSARMKKVEILTLVSDEPKVTEAVGEMGVLHLTRAPAESGAVPVESAESHETRARLDGLLARAEALCDVLGLEPGRAPVAPAVGTLSEVEGELSRIESEVSRITGERDELRAARVQIEKLLRDTSMLRDIEAPVEQLEHLTFLHFAIGDMSGSAAATAEQEMGEQAVVLPYRTPFGESKVVAISSKKNRWALESSLERHGFRRGELPEGETGVASKIAELAEQRMQALLDRTREVRRAIQAAAEAHGDRALAVRRRMRTERRLLVARENFAHTWATMLITGWVPAERLGALCETVLDLTHQRAVIEVHDPASEDGEPPTLMRNHPLVRPFEMLVSSYSTPRYDEIEPTPFVAVLFLLMFGLMFGDVGHSGLLLIAGALMWRKGRAAVRDLGVIVTLCGVSGIVFGTIYGSVFGSESVIRGLLPPLDNVANLLALTVCLGVGVISLGIILNVVNRFRRREYAAGWFTGFGVAGGILYWGSIVVGVRGVVTGSVSGVLVGLVIGVPLLVILAYKPVAQWLGGRRGGPGGVWMAAVESAIEAFETVLAFVANTMSFLRVGAFAIVHAGLSLAVFELVKQVNRYPGGWLWAPVVFLFGTLLIVCLEGVIVAIQCLRLDYYEFFTKFFRGDGRQYEPFRLEE